MAKVAYTAYSFRPPALMDAASFAHLKSLPVKPGQLRYHPYDGFWRTFPVWTGLIVVALVWSVVLRWQGDDSWGVPWLVLFIVSVFSGGLFSIASWLKFYVECWSYFAEYSDDINKARDYDDLRRLRRGKHG